jgi:hypothetical protein
MQAAAVSLAPFQLAVTCLAIFVALALGFRSILRDRYKDLVDQLDDPADRQAWVIRLSRETPIHLRYSLALFHLNVVVARVYAAPRSFQALERSLIFTLIYPFVLYLVGWTLGGSNKYGNLVFLGSSGSGATRLFVAAGYLSTVALAANAIRLIPGSEQLFVFGKQGVFRSYRLRDWRRLGICLAAFCGLWLLNQSLTHSGYAVSFAVYVLLAFSLYFGWRATMTQQAPSSPIIGMTLPLMLAALAFAVAYYGLGGGTIAFLVLFFLMFPAVNAVFDFLSWIVTRWFLKLAESLIPDRDSYTRLLRGLAYDIVWAIFCLVALTLALGICLRIYDAAFPQHAAGWREQLLAMQQVGSGSSLLISGMVATTFVPTFIHLFVGSAGVLVAFSPRAERVVALLSDPKLSKGGKQEAARAIRRIKAMTYAVPTFAAVVMCSIPTVVAVTLGPVASTLAMTFIDLF